LQSTDQDLKLAAFSKANGCSECKELLVFRAPSREPPAAADPARRRR